LTHWKPVLETDTNNEGVAGLRFPPYGPNRVQEILTALSGGEKKEWGG